MKHIYLANSPLVQEVSYTKTSNPSRILMSRRNSCDALNRLSATYSQAGGIQRQWNYSYDRTKCQVIRKKCRREVILSGARLTGTVEEGEHCAAGGFEAEVARRIDQHVQPAVRTGRDLGATDGRRDRARRQDRR